MDRQRKTVLALAVTQALFQTGAVLILTIGGLAGQLLAPSASLATLPIATVAIGTAVATIPASLLMSRLGRRTGFLAGAAFGAAGGGVAALAVAIGSFPLLCLGTFIVGAYQACAQFYRFAAAEAASPEFRSRAISLVLAGGVVAAVLGPHLGAATKDLLGGAVFAGSFLAVTVLSLIAGGVLAFAPLPTQVAAEQGAAPARPFLEIARQPKFVADVIGAAIGYAAMVMIMTATPLSMKAHDHGLPSTALVIQWHVLGMFVPSFFTGWLVKKFGLTTMMLTGVALLAAEIAVVISGVGLPHYLTGLVLLGLGWNFLYIGGSTLLTETYRPSEKGKVQGLNDFMIVTVAAASSFSAGALVEQFGWRGLNVAVLPFLAVAAATILLAGLAERRRLARLPA